MQYLAKCPRPAINNGPGSDSNSAHILASWHSYKSYSNNSPSQTIPILGQIEDIPVQVSHLWSGRCYIWTNNTGLTSIMAQEVTQIIAALWPLGIYSSLARIMVPSPGHSNFVSNEGTAVQVSYLCFSGCCHIWPRATGLASIMAQEVTQIMTAFWPPGFIRVRLNNGPLPRPFQFCVKWRHSFQVSYLCFPGCCHIWPGLTSIIAQKVTQIMATFWPPTVYSSLTQIKTLFWPPAFIKAWLE